MSTPLKWEFPGGKVEAGEHPEAALAREIREELELEIEVSRWLGRGTCPAGSQTLVLDVYLAQARFPHAENGHGRPRLREHDQYRWLSADELPTLEWAVPDIPVIPAVQMFLREKGREPQPPPALRNFR